MPSSQQVADRRRQNKRVINHLGRVAARKCTDQERKALNVDIYRYLASQPRELMPTKAEQSAISRQEWRKPEREKKAVRDKARRKAKATLKRNAYLRRVYRGLALSPPVAGNFLRVKVHDRIARELAARRLRTFGGNPNDFNYLRGLLTQMGEQYGYNVKHRGGLLLWQHRATGKYSYVFLVNKQWYWSGVKVLKSFYQSYRIALFYDQTDMKRYGSFINSLQFKPTAMTVFNMTEGWEARVGAFKAANSLLTEGEIYELQQTAAAA